MNATDAPHAVLDAARRLGASGLTPGRSGNVSARCGAGMVITPSGLDYDPLTADDLVVLGAAGRVEAGGRAPSSEWPLHSAIYAARPEIGAVVHTHSRHATALACTAEGQARGIPPFHYMVAVAGGEDIRCAPYATFGTPALAEGAVAALEGRRACLLAHHGVVAVGESPAAALALAAEVEELAAQYLLARSAGEVRLLAPDELRVVLARFVTYGQPDPSRR